MGALQSMYIFSLYLTLLFLLTLGTSFYIYPQDANSAHFGHIATDTWEDVYTVASTIPPTPMA